MAPESLLTQAEPSVATGIQAVILEFGRLLEIFSGQLAESLQEADRECMAVGESFHGLAAAKARIQSVDCGEPARSVLQTGCDEIGDSIAAAVVALQYHDRLAQRVGHIRVGLNHLQNVLRRQSAGSTDEWLSLLRNIERTYDSEWQRLARPQAVGEEAEPDADSSLVELF